MNRWPRGFFALLGAQFFSSWADNALLIVAIAQLIATDQPAWTAPLLKCLFTLAYVVLAPWVGFSADGWSKTRVMWVAHALKLMGVMGLWLGWDILLSYAWVGVGAALYSPAKYGWITQNVKSMHLVRANGWLETLTVCSAIGGVACGGWWISESFRGLALIAWACTALEMSLQQLPLSLVAMMYMVTLSLTCVVPPVRPHEPTDVIWHRRVGHFFQHDWWSLWSDRSARTALCITTLFWGVGASMQLLVLDWAQHHLGLPLEGGAYLQGMTGLGVVLGAALAGRWVTLDKHRWVLWCGVALGGLLPCMVWVDDGAWALPFTVGAGLLSGLLIVPMNAMLQHRGLQVLTSGRSIAVQNFNENLSILLMLGGYALMVHGQWPLWLILGVYAVLMMGMSLYFIWPDRRAQTQPGPGAGGPQS